MLTVVKNQLRVTFLSIKYGIIKEMTNKITFIMSITFMILNNASFIIQWVILFSLKESFGSYDFKDIILIWGFAAGVYGISRGFFQNTFHLSKIINQGKLDSYLIQPKSVLISVITSKISPSALGDIIYAYIMLIAYGITPLNFLLFTLLIILGSIIVVALSIITESLSFWVGDSSFLSESINNMTTNLATYPDAIFTGAIRIIFYTIIPVAYISYIPVGIMNEINIYSILLIIGIAILSIIMAYITFYKGLKKYSSSSLMVARI